MTDSQIAEHVQRIQVLGYTLIPGFLPSVQTRQLRDMVVSLHEQTKGQSYGELSEVRPDDGLLLNLQNKDYLFIDLISSRSFTQLVSPLINDPYYAELPAEAPNYILGELIARASGRQKLRLHIDSWMPSPGKLTWMLQAIFVLEERGVEEGCSVVVPGSHLSGSYTDREFKNPVPVPAKPGDLVILDARLWHGALPSTTDAGGWAVVATLQRWWVKPRFNISSGLPDEIFTKLTDSQKALMGYCSVPPRDEFTGQGPRQGYDWVAKNRKFSQ